MRITITGHMAQDAEFLMTSEEIHEQIIVPICQEFRLHGLEITEIKAEDLTS